MKYLLTALIILEIGDGFLTNFLIQNNLAKEGNPLLLNLAGEPLFLILKIVGVLAAAFVLWDVYHRYRTVALVVTSCFVVFYAGIACWNLRCFFLS
jgi:hypothetical protein